LRHFTPKLKKILEGPRRGYPLLHPPSVLEASALLRLSGRLCLPTTFAAPARARHWVRYWSYLYLVLIGVLLFILLCKYVIHRFSRTATDN